MSLLRPAKNNGLVSAFASHQHYKRHIARLQNKLASRGKFSSQQLFDAFLDEAASKEAIALWLRGQLEKLRAARKVAGRSPIRREKMLSQLDIANVAQTMMECLSEAPGVELLALVRELLDVDRHRKEVAGRTAINRERVAQFEAEANYNGTPYKVRDLARLANVSIATISNWRSSAEYRRTVQMFQKEHRSDRDYINSFTQRRSKK